MSTQAVEVPPKKGEVIQALDTLNINIDSLAEEVANLDGRITPIMRSEPPDELAKDGTSYNTPLANTLQGMTAKLSDVRAAVRLMMDRVEV